MASVNRSITDAEYDRMANILSSLHAFRWLITAHLSVNRVRLRRKLPWFNRVAPS
jgi:hypothetical protein